MSDTAQLVTAFQSSIATEHWMDQANRVLAESKAVTTVTAETIELSAQKQSEITKMISALGKARKAHSGPLEAAKKKMIALEKQLTLPLEEEKTRLQAANSAYITRQRKEADEAAQRAEQEKAEAEMAAADLFGGEVTCEVQAPTVPTKVASESIRQVSRIAFEVVNIKEVPEALITVNERAVRDHIAVLKKQGLSVAEIQSRLPGLKVTETFQAVSR
jgi:hypothetical protein